MQTDANDANVYWVRDAEHAFVAKKKSECTSKELAHHRTYPVHNEASLTTDVIDLVQLNSVNEASILNNLRLRFATDQIYTSLGTIIIAVNPFTWIDGMYTQERLRQYQGASARGETNLEPHAYATAERAYYGMMERHRNQSIIISGESGAGKTEATKTCLAYLAVVAQSSSGVEKRILAANPVLEAFGNAKTVRNDNSSRFGKWMESYFDTHGMIVGCSNQNFLLEKSRVVMQETGERNYHSFYHLISGADESLRRQLHISSGADYYHYTNQSGVYTLPGRPSETVMWNNLLNAFKELNFSELEIAGISTALASILHIGNIKFMSESHEESGSESDSSQIDRSLSEPSLVALLDLLGWSDSLLEKSLCSRLVTSGRGSSYAVQIRPAEAAEGRDALSKLIYNSLFDWIVGRVNVAVRNEKSSTDSADLDGVRKVQKRVDISGKTPSGGALLGVLDIFGFEIFESNSFEQLCINFCNERLQQQFNKTTFEEETNMYKSEGIPFNDISFEDNTPVISLISAKRTGLLPMLDEEGRVPRGTSKSWFNKIKKVYGSPSSGRSSRGRAGLKAGTKTSIGKPFSPNAKAKLAQQKEGPSSRFEVVFDKFIVVHYAGIVKYHVDGFMEKNKDTVSNDIQLLPKASSNFFLRQLFDDDDTDNDLDDDKAVGRRTRVNLVKRKKGKTTVGRSFCRQLNELMSTLHATDSHYIRCIKPNQKKSPKLFESNIVLEQLRYSGVFEAVAIRKSGYPFRYKHEYFFRRYHMLMDLQVKRNLNDQMQEKKWKECCEALIDSAKRLLAGVVEDEHTIDGKLESLLSDCWVGKTMVLYRSPQHRWLESQRAVLTLEAATKMQASLRKFLIQCSINPLLKAHKDFISILSEDPFPCESVAGPLRDVIDRFESIPSRITVRTCAATKYAEAKKLMDVLERRLKVKNMLRHFLSEKDFFAQHDAISSALVEAKDCGLNPGNCPDVVGLATERNEKISAVIKAKSQLDMAVQSRNIVELRKSMADVQKHKDILSKIMLKYISKEEGLGDNISPPGSSKSTQFAFLNKSVTTANQVMQEVEDEIQLVSTQLLGALAHGAVKEIHVEQEIMGQGVSILGDSRDQVAQNHVAHLLPLIDSFRKKGLKSVQTVAMIELAEAIVELRRSAIMGDIDKLESLMKNIEQAMSNSTSDAREAVRIEVDMVKKEITLKRRLPVMLEILKSGAAKFNTETGCTVVGVPADISTIDLTGLSTILDEELSERDSEQLHILNRVAADLFRLRQAWMQEDWDSLESVINEENSSIQIKGNVVVEAVVPEEVVDEIEMAKFEAKYHLLVRRAEDALSNMSAILCKIPIGELHKHVSTNPQCIACTKLTQIVYKELSDAIELDNDICNQLSVSLKVILELQKLLQLKSGIGDGSTLSDGYSSNRIDWQELEHFILKYSDEKASDTLSGFVISYLHRVQKEVNDWRIFRNVVQAISHGGLIGPKSVEESFKITNLELESIQSALDLAEKTDLLSANSDIIQRSEKCHHIIEVARIVLQVRKNIMKETWEEIRDYLAETNRYSLAKGTAAEEEILYCRSLSQDRITAKSLHEACETCTISGKVGILDFSHASVDKLDSIITAVSNGSCLSAPPSKIVLALLKQAQRVRAIRAAALEGDWSLVDYLVTHAPVVDIWSESIPSIEDSGEIDRLDQNLSNSINKIYAIPHAVAECELMRREIIDRKLREQIVGLLLCPAFKSGMLIQIGSMEANAVSLDNFDELLKLLTSDGETNRIGYRSPVLVVLQNVFVRLKTHRESLVALLSNSNTEHLPKLLQELSQSILELERILPSMRSVNLEHTDKIMAQISQDLNFAKEELSEMQRIDQLRSALSSGCAEGSPESFKISSIVISELESVLGLNDFDNTEVENSKEETENVKTNHIVLQSDCLSPVSAFLLSLCPLILELRRYIMGKEWRHVLNMCKQITSKIQEQRQKECIRSIPSQLMVEIQDAKAAASITMMLGQLNLALESGAARVAGDGFLDLSKIETSKLKSALDLVASQKVDESIPVDRRVIRLHSAATYILRLRVLLKSNGWDQIDILAKEAFSLPVRLPQIALDEIRDALQEAHERKIIAACEHALVSGSATLPKPGSSNHMDLTTISLAEPKRALKISIEYGGANSVKGKRLLQQVHTITSLREAMINNMWENVSKITTSAIEEQGMMLNEVMGARIESKNMVAIQLLQRALAEGAAVGKIGELLGNKKISYGELSKAIDQAMHISVSDSVEELPKLISCAKHIRRIRTALFNGDLNDLGSALGIKKTLNEIETTETSSTDDRVSFFFSDVNFDDGWNPISKAEYMQAKYEFVSAATCNALKRVLDAGAIAGKAGALELPTEHSIAVIEDQLEKAQNLTHTSLQMRQLLRSGRTILHIRKAVIAEKWHELDILLHSTKITTAIGEIENDVDANQSTGKSALLVQETQRHEWNMLASHSRYFVLRSMMVRAMEIGQVSFMSDGQIGYASISSSSIKEAIDPCALAMDIALSASSKNISNGIDDQFFVAQKFQALTLAGSTVLYLRQAIKDREWSKARDMLKEFRESQGILRASAEAGVVKSLNTVNGDDIKAVQVCITDGILMNVVFRELDLMEQAIEVGEISQNLEIFLVDPRQQIRGVPGLLDISGVDCDSLEQAAMAARSLIVRSDTSLSWLASLISAADSILRIRSALVKLKKKQDDSSSNLIDTYPSHMDFDLFWSEHLDVCIEQAKHEIAVHHHCEDELALVIRERRYQHGMLGLERLAKSLQVAIVHASISDLTSLRDHISNLIGDGSLREDKDEIGDRDSPKKYPKTHAQQRRGSFVESLLEVRESSLQNKSNSKTPVSSPHEKEIGSEQYRSLTFEHVLAAMRLESNYDSAHIRTAVTLAEWCHSLYLSLQACDFRQVQILADKFVNLKDTVEACKSKERFLRSLAIMSRLSESASLLCRKQYLISKLKQALQVELPIDAYHHIDIDRLSISDLDRVLVEIRASKRKFLEHSQESNQISVDSKAVSSEFSILFKTSDLVLRMRKAMASDEWDSVEMILSEAITLVESGDFSPLAVEEISIVETELMNQKAFRLLHLAIYHKAIDDGIMPNSGVLENEIMLGENLVIDDINVMADDVDALASALEQIKNDDLEISSEIVQQLMNLCQVLLQLRRARLAKDWGAVKRIIKVAQSLPTMDDTPSFQGWLHINEETFEADTDGKKKFDSPLQKQPHFLNSDLNSERNRFVVRISKLQHSCLKLINDSRIILHNRETREAITQVMRNLIDIKCSKLDIYKKGIRGASISQDQALARGISREDELSKLITKVSSDSSFMQDKANMLFITTVQHILTICRLIGINHVKDISEEAWSAVLSAESHAESNLWPESARLGLKSLKNFVQINRVETKLLESLKQGQVHTLDTHHKEVDASIKATYGKSDLSDKLFGRSNIVMHFLDRSNISVEKIDEALAFSVHASIADKIKIPISASSSHSDLSWTDLPDEAEANSSSLHSLLGSVRLVRNARVACMPGASFPRSFEPGNPLSKLLLDKSLIESRVHPAAHQELEVICTAAVNAFLYRSLAAALSQGGPIGTIGSLDFQACSDTSRQKQALSAADAMHSSNQFEVYSCVKILRESLRNVLAARELVIQEGAGGCSEKNAELLNLLDMKLSYVDGQKEGRYNAVQNDTTTLPLHSVAATEFRMLRDEISHQGILDSFDAIINSGSISQSGTSVLPKSRFENYVSTDVLLPSLAEIESVISLADDIISETLRLHGTNLRTAAVNVQILAAKSLRNLILARNTLMKKYGSHDYSSKESQAIMMKVIADFDAELSSNKIPMVVLSEFQRARKQVEIGLINSELRKAISLGGPKGVVGNLNVDSVRVDDLEKAISVAEALEVPEGTDSISLRSLMQLVRDARGLLALRLALTQGDIEKCADSPILLEININEAVPEAKEELILLRDEIFNGKIARMIRAALSHGGPYESGGALTERAPGASIDGRGIETQALESALAASKTSVSSNHSIEVKLLIKSAETVLILRKSLIDSISSGVTSNVAEDEEARNNNSREKFNNGLLLGTNLLGSLHEFHPTAIPELRLFAAHAATMSANQIYEAAVHQYMVYKDKDQNADENIEGSEFRNDHMTSVGEHVEYSEKTFSRCETAVKRLLSTSHNDDSTRTLRSDVQVHRVLVSIRCLHELHEAQKPPLDLNSWQNIADIVTKAMETDDLMLLPFPNAELSRLHIAVLKYMALNRLFSAMSVGGAARLDTDGVVVTVTEDNDVEDSVDFLPNDSKSSRRRGSTLLLDSSGVRTHHLRQEIEKVQLLRARLPMDQDIIDALSVSRNLHALREAVIEGDWEAAASNQLLNQIYDQNLGMKDHNHNFTVSDLDKAKALACCSAEVSVVKTYCMTRRVRGALRRALMHNTSKYGDRFDETGITELDAAISAALSLAPDTAEDIAIDAQRLMESAHILRKVRLLSSQQYYQQVIDFVSELKRTLVPEVLDEIATRVRKAREYVCFHQLEEVITELHPDYATNIADNSRSNADYNGYDLDSDLIIDKLRSVIDNVEERLHHGSGMLSTLSEETLALLQICRAVLELRLCFRNASAEHSAEDSGLSAMHLRQALNQAESIYNLLVDNEFMSNGSQGHKSSQANQQRPSMIRIFREEIDAVNSFYNDSIVRSNITAALNSFLTAAVSADAVSGLLPDSEGHILRLNIAVQHAIELGACRSRTTRLVRTAKVLRELEIALNDFHVNNSPNWELVESLLQKFAPRGDLVRMKLKAVESTINLTGEADDLIDIIAEDRIRCLWNKVHAHRIVELVLLGLKNGSISVNSESGDVELRRVSVQHLRRAVDSIENYTMRDISEADIQLYHGANGSGFLLLRDMLQALLLARVHIQTGDYQMLYQSSAHKLEKSYESCNLFSQNMKIPLTGAAEKQFGDHVESKISSKNATTPALMRAAIAGELSNILSLVEAEISALRLACDTQQVVLSIRSALNNSSGQVSGENGEINKNLRLRSGMQSLKLAIDAAEASGLTSSHSIQALKETAIIVYKLREAVVEDQWEDAVRVINLSVEAATDGKLDDCSVPEINCVLEHVEKKEIVSKLWQALKFSSDWNSNLMPSISDTKESMSLLSSSISRAQDADFALRNAEICNLLAVAKVTVDLTNCILKCLLIDDDEEFDSQTILMVADDFRSISKKSELLLHDLDSELHVHATNVKIYAENQAHVFSVLNAMRLPEDLTVSNKSNADKIGMATSIDGATANLALVLATVERECYSSHRGGHKNQSPKSKDDQKDNKPSVTYATVEGLSHLPPLIHEVLSVGNSIMTFRKLVREGGDWMGVVHIAEQLLVKQSDNMTILGSKKKLPKYLVNELITGVQHAQLQHAYESMLSSAHDLAVATIPTGSAKFSLKDEEAKLKSLLKDLQLAISAAENCVGFNEDTLVACMCHVLFSVVDVFMNLSWKRLSQSLCRKSMEVVQMLSLERFTADQQAYIKRNSTPYFTRLAFLPRKAFAPPAKVIRSLVGNALSAVVTLQCCWRHFRLRIRVQNRLALKAKIVQQEKKFEQFGVRIRNAFEQMTISTGKTLDPKLESASSDLRQVLYDATQGILKEYGGTSDGYKSENRPMWQVLYQQALCYINLEDACNSGRVELIADALHSYAERIREGSWSPAAIGKVGTTAVIFLLERIELLSLPEIIEHSLANGSITNMIADNRRHHKNSLFDASTIETTSLDFVLGHVERVNSRRQSLTSLIKTARAMLKLREALFMALPKMPTEGSEAALLHSYFASSDHAHMYDRVDDAILSLSEIVASKTTFEALSQNAKTIVETEISSAKEAVCVARCICKLSHCLLQKPVDLLSPTKSVVAVTLESQTLNIPNTQLAGVLQEIGIFLLQPQYRIAGKDMHLQNLIHLTKVILSMRSHLQEVLASNVTSKAEDSTFISHSSTLRSLIEEYKMIVTDTPTLAILCDNEVNFVLRYESRQREVAHVVEELRDSYRAVTLCGDTILNQARDQTDSKTEAVNDYPSETNSNVMRGREAVTLLRKAVMAGRKLDLSTNPNPRVVAYYKRSELLLEDVERLLDTLRTGLKYQNVKALHAGVRDAERIGFDSVEVQAARGFLNAHLLEE